MILENRFLEMTQTRNMMGIEYSSVSSRKGLIRNPLDNKIIGVR